MIWLKARNVVFRKHRELIMNLISYTLDLSAFASCYVITRLMC